MRLFRDGQDNWGLNGRTSPAKGGHVQACMCAASQAGSEAESRQRRLVAGLTADGNPLQGPDFPLFTDKADEQVLMEVATAMMAATGALKTAVYSSVIALCVAACTMPIEECRTVESAERVLSAGTDKIEAGLFDMSTSGDLRDWDEAYRMWSARRERAGRLDRACGTDLSGALTKFETTYQEHRWRRRR